ncbi:hypothetical protein DL769_000464 [Monosporascus sp. CRB-8-3]|nr:hypothetical protein DL769_000464 [Monosporascus sp. CRB-8-3]
MSSAFDDFTDSRAFTGSERKFNPGLSFVSLLSGHLWRKPKAQNRETFDHQEGGTFSVLSQPGQLIRDTYYETGDNHLSNLGFWVRQRYVQAHVLPLHSPRVEVADGKSKAEWNAKLRVGGHFTNSQFVEFDEKNVSREVLRISGARRRVEDLQMTIVMDVVTEAEAEACEGARSDESAFSHTIGEVELFQTVVTEGKSNVEHEAHRKDIATRRMIELEAFMQAHTDLFATRPTPIGKLTAYYRWKAVGSRP